MFCPGNTAPPPDGNAFVPGSISVALLAGGGGPFGVVKSGGLWQVTGTNGQQRIG